MLTGLILHELGHSFLYHNWSFTRTGRFRRAFGEVRKAYRVADSKWVDFERRGVTTTLPNYVTAYAATHPQEDFAETFRFYVAPPSTRPWRPPGSCWARSAASSWPLRRS